MPTFRNTCPRHCYGTCGIISHINGKKLTRVLGDTEHGYTQGRLCSKGYALIQYALDENRLKYPMRQVRRGSDEWRRISWDQAYDLIAHKILELNSCYHSNLAAGYFKGTGNTGFLHRAPEGMFAGIGSHTRPVGDICWSTGELALRETIGDMKNPDPEEMTQAGLIVLWGANPAVTNINQMKFIYKARSNGAVLVVIDPILSHSAERADLYIQINPGTDAWLAWGIAKVLLTGGCINNKYIYDKTVGWEQFQTELNKISLDEVCSRTRTSHTVLEELASLYSNLRPVASWLGFGLQRNRCGSQAVKAISALTALTGNYEASGGGIYYCHRHIEDFPQALAGHQGMDHPSGLSSREIPANDYARQALALNNPPLKMLWISCGNPLAQDHNLKAWQALLQQLELIVTVDLYLTKTVRQSDLVLPAASFFEQEDLHISFWHHWLSVNQKVLPTFFESKSDLQIARDLTDRLNSLEPGFSNFPSYKEPDDWIQEELSPYIREFYGITDESDLSKRPFKRKAESLPSAWKYHFSPPQPDLFPPLEATHPPYHLLTPQSLLKFHTQYETLDWLNTDREQVIELAQITAERHDIRDGMMVELYNKNGSLTGRAKINPCLSENTIVTEQSDCCPVNGLISCNPNGTGSIPYYDCMVYIRRVSAY